MSKKKNKKKETKQTTKKQKIKQVIDTHQGWALKGFLVSSILLILTGVLYQYWLHKQYQKTLTYILPYESTAFALEINHNPSLDQVQKLNTHIYKDEIKEFINPEQSVLNKTSISETIESSPQKIFTYQIFENQLYPTFIYRLNSPIKQSSFPAEILEQQSNKKWKYFSKDNLLIISESKDLNIHLYESQKDFRASITQNPKFQDSFNQLPLHNLGYFYANHQVLEQLSNDTLFPQNNISQITNLTNNLGFTTGYLRLRDKDLLVGTYTNLQNESRTYFSPKSNLLKYKGDLIQFIPPNTHLAIYGTQLTPILKTIVQNNLQNSNFKQALTSHLVSFNLDPDQDFNTLAAIFESEYSIYQDPEDQSINMIIPKQTIQSQQNILDLLSRLESHFNPQIISYKLEDGSTAKNIISSKPTFRSIEISEKNFNFDLKDIDTDVTLSLDNSEYDLLKIARPDPYLFEPISTELSLEPILEQGSSHSSFSQQFLQAYLETIFLKEYANLPNSQNSFYFFDDGLQTISALSW